MPEFAEGTPDAEVRFPAFEALRGSASVPGLDDGTVLSPLPARGSRRPESVESAPSEGGGASGKRAEAGGGGGMLPGYRALVDSGRRLSWAPEWFAGAEGASPPALRPSGVACASPRIGVEVGPVPSVVRIGGRPAALARGAVAPTSSRPAPAG
ncbi:hypothetical protein [Streptomyces sp. NPDC058307]|uniref:hypothetical protein n=1 Tax=Streptomyces sp. NPDC058307 TaxID=3346439 RepID=UPI0036E9B201